MSITAINRRRRLALYERHPYCFWCGGRVREVPVPPGMPQPPDLATLDHLFSRAAYGPGRPSSRATVLACRRCNAERGLTENAGLDWVPPLTASARPGCPGTGVSGPAGRNPGTWIVSKIRGGDLDRAVIIPPGKFRGRCTDLACGWEPVGTTPHNLGRELQRHARKNRHRTRMTVVEVTEYRPPRAGSSHR